jgi:hypothetical protein
MLLLRILRILLYCDPTSQLSSSILPHHSSSQAAGWIKKEQYGDANTFMKHDISHDHTHPALMAVLEGAVAENDSDLQVRHAQLRVPLFLPLCVCAAPGSMCSYTHLQSYACAIRVYVVFIHPSLHTPLPSCAPPFMRPSIRHFTTAGCQSPWPPSPRACGGRRQQRVALVCEADGSSTEGRRSVYPLIYVR